MHIQHAHTRSYHGTADCGLHLDLIHAKGHNVLCVLMRNHVIIEPKLKGMKHNTRINQHVTVMALRVDSFVQFISTLLKTEEHQSNRRC